MRAWRGLVVGMLLLLLTGCVAYGPGPSGYGYGYGSGYSYRPAYPVYVAPSRTVVVPVVRYPQYRPYRHRHWRH
jgi:hypothetical protein